MIILKVTKNRVSLSHWKIPHPSHFRIKPSKGATSTRIEKHDNSTIFHSKNDLETLEVEKQFYTFANPPENIS